MGSHLDGMGSVAQQHSAGPHEGAGPGAGSFVTPGALLRRSQAVMACCCPITLQDPAGVCPGHA